MYTFKFVVYLGTRGVFARHGVEINFIPAVGMKMNLIVNESHCACEVLSVFWTEVPEDSKGKFAVWLKPHFLSDDDEDLRNFTGDMKWVKEERK